MSQGPGPGPRADTDPHVGARAAEEAARDALRPAEYRDYVARVLARGAVPAAAGRVWQGDGHPGGARGR